MLASVFIDSCISEGIDFFTGVPDSFLKGFCDALYCRFGVDGKNHLVAHNEGGAVALCAGHYLCYMQNSGLGNAVNPLASLMDSQVYRIPCLLLIGWRGEPGVKDEPQHVKQGAVTLSQLELLGIPYFVLSPDTSEDRFRNEFHQLARLLCEEKVVAVVARKGTFVSDCSPDYSNKSTLKREQAAAAVLNAAGREDIFVSTTGKLSREIYELREARGEGHEHDFLTVGSMGHASMIALRIAVEHPEKRVWCLDGDGAMMMHLGSLPLIGTSSPSNLIHVIINNGAHETVGGMPVCAGKLNICSLAFASGYHKVYKASAESDLSGKLAALLSDSRPGPALIEIMCACGARADLGRPASTPLENRNALMSELI